VSNFKGRPTIASVISQLHQTGQNQPSHLSRDHHSLGLFETNLFTAPHTIRVKIPPTSKVSDRLITNPIKGHYR